MHSPLGLPTKYFCFLVMISGKESGRTVIPTRKQCYLFHSQLRIIIKTYWGTFNGALRFHINWSLFAPIYCTLTCGSATSTQKPIPKFRLVNHTLRGSIFTKLLNEFHSNDCMYRFFSSSFHLVKLFLTYFLVLFRFSMLQTVFRWNTSLYSSGPHTTTKAHTNYQMTWTILADTTKFPAPPLFRLENHAPWCCCLLVAQEPKIGRKN